MRLQRVLLSFHVWAKDSKLNLFTRTKSTQLLWPRVLNVNCTAAAAAAAGHKRTHIFHRSAVGRSFCEILMKLKDQNNFNGNFTSFVRQTRPNQNRGHCHELPVMGSDVKWKLCSFVVFSQVGFVPVHICAAVQNVHHLIQQSLCKFPGSSVFTSSILVKKETFWPCFVPPFAKRTDHVQTTCKKDLAPTHDSVILIVIRKICVTALEK